jgi:hypothetical protein
VRSSGDLEREREKRTDKAHLDRNEVKSERVRGERDRERGREGEERGRGWTDIMVLREPGDTDRAS